MKKIFTLLLAFSSLTIFAQRSCDVEVTMTKPTAGQIIRSGEQFNITYSVKNLGPGSLLAGDTVLWGLAINNVIVNGSLYFRVLTADVAKDAVIQTYNQNVTLTIPNATPDANFCATFSAFKRVSGVAQVTDPSTTNNLGCQVVNMRSSGIKVIGDGIAVASNINASPNPANDVVTVSYFLVNPATVTVSLFDMNGRQVVGSVTDKQGAGDNSLQLNTSELEAGLYFYEVKIGNDSKRYKLMVN